MAASAFLPPRPPPLPSAASSSSSNASPPPSPADARIAAARARLRAAVSGRGAGGGGPDPLAAAARAARVGTGGGSAAAAEPDPLRWEGAGEAVPAAALVAEARVLVAAVREQVADLRAAVDRCEGRGRGVGKRKRRGAGCLATPALFELTPRPPPHHSQSGLTRAVARRHARCWTSSPSGRAWKSCWACWRRFAGSWCEVGGVGGRGVQSSIFFSVDFFFC
jgi:hypothetical protein